MHEFFIFSCLEKNEYNHVTATYYLLAERKLKSKAQEQLNKNKRPDQLSVSQALQTEKNKCSTTRPFLSIPRTPGELPQVGSMLPTLYFLNIFIVPFSII